VSKPERLIVIFLTLGIVAALAYWIFLFITTGSAPSFSDLLTAGQGGLTSVTGIGKLNFSDLVGLAQNAGFSGDDANTAAAIALAESSGNPSAVGDLNVTPGGSIGLWQINLKAHPEYTASQLTDPATNASAAYAIYSAAGGFSPWTTYNSGAYETYLPSQNPAGGQQNASNDAASTGGTLSAMGSTPTAIGGFDDDGDQSV
jgi:hypothetical protein